MCEECEILLFGQKGSKDRAISMTVRGMSLVKGSPRFLHFSHMKSAPSPELHIHFVNIYKMMVVFFT